MPPVSQFNEKKMNQLMRYFSVVVLLTCASICRADGRWRFQETDWVRYPTQLASKNGLRSNAV